MVPAPKCCPIGVAKGKVPSLGQLAFFNYGTRKDMLTLLRSFAAENACTLNGCVIAVTFPNTASLHNRESFNEGYFKFIPPTMSLVKTNDIFTLRHQGISLNTI